MCEIFAVISQLHVLQVGDCVYEEIHIANLVLLQYATHMFCMMPKVFIQTKNEAYQKTVVSRRIVNRLRHATAFVLHHGFPIHHGPNLFGPTPQEGGCRIVGCRIVDCGPMPAGGPNFHNSPPLLMETTFQ